jgi:hypothetical protein
MSTPESAVVSSSTTQEDQVSDKLRRSGLLSKQKGGRHVLKITDSSVRSALDEQRKSLAMYSMKSMRVCRENPDQMTSKSTINTDEQQQQQLHQQTAILYGTLNYSNMFDDDDGDDDDDNDRRQRSSYQSNTTSSNVSEQRFHKPKTTQTAAASDTTPCLDAQISLAAQDSMQVERLCQRFHQLFTTGTSSITSQDIDNALGSVGDGGGGGSRPSGSMNSFSSSVSSSRYESFYYPAVLVATASRACIIQTDATSTTGEGIEFSCLPTEPSSSLILPSAEEQQQEEEEDYHESSSSSSLQLLEVAPGISLPLKSLQQTWAGIRTGRINISTCLQCQEELTFVDDLRLVVCGDCWTVNPIDNKRPGGGGGNNDDDEEGTLLFDPTKDFVGLGVKNSDIVAWMENGCRESFSKY